MVSRRSRQVALLGGVALVLVVALAVWLWGRGDGNAENRQWDELRALPGVARVDRGDAAVFMRRDATEPQVRRAIRLAARRRACCRITVHQGGVFSAGVAETDVALAGMLAALGPADLGAERAGVSGRGAISLRVARREREVEVARRALAALIASGPDVLARVGTVRVEDGVPGEDIAITSGVALPRAERALERLAPLAGRLTFVRFDGDDARAGVLAPSVAAAPAAWAEAARVAARARLDTLLLELGPERSDPIVYGRPTGSIGAALPIVRSLRAARGTGIRVEAHGRAVSADVRRVRDAPALAVAAARSAPGAERLTIAWNDQESITDRPAVVARMMPGIAALERRGRAVKWASGRPPRLTVWTAPDTDALRATRRVNWAGTAGVSLYVQKELCTYRFRSTAHGRTAAAQGGDSCKTPARTVAERWNTTEG